MASTTLKLSDIVERIAAKADYPASVVKSVLLAEQEVVGHELARGNEVPALNGALKLSVMERSARAGRNPKTGETITIPAKRAVRVKIRKKLQDMVV